MRPDIGYPFGGSHKEVPVSRNTPVTPPGWAIAAGGLLLIVLSSLGPGSETALAQLNLQVFQKEGVSEEQQSKDRHECHLWVTGKSDAERPPAMAGEVAPEPPWLLPRRGEVERKKREEMEAWKHRTRYLRAVRECLESRGYRLVEH